MGMPLSMARVASVRLNLWGVDALLHGLVAELLQALLHAAYRESAARARQRHEQRLVAIVPLVEVSLEVDLGTGIEVHLTLLGALAAHHALSTPDLSKGMGGAMKKHRFWAWAMVACAAMCLYTGYKKA